jgi:hypothetical protein
MEAEMRLIAGLAVMATLAIAAPGAANATTFSYSFNLDDYNDVLLQVPIGTVPVGSYNVSMSSNVPILLFEFGNLLNVESEQFFPDGSYMGGDENSFEDTLFSVNPTDEGHPFTDQEVGSVPPTSVFEEFYYPSGPLYSIATTTVDSSYISLATEMPGGEATITLTAVPEPATWAIMLAGFGLMGLVLRARGPGFATGRAGG